MIEYTNSQFTALVNEHTHSERDRNILIDRYVNGLLFKELADKYGLSERRIKVICYREFDKIAKLINI